MIVTIDVSADDIAQGRIGECRHCPLALALERTLTPRHHQDAWEVDEFSCKIEAVVEIDLPLHASEFIVAFDAGYAVAPFSFQLDLPANAAEFVTVPS